MFDNPTTDDFKAYFFRDFPFGPDINSQITDQDLMNAFAETIITINPCLFMNQQAYNIGFMLLAAHILTMNIRASSQGLSGSFSWSQTSRSVGSVSESVQIPDQILANPEYSYYTQTNYGARYLMMILPYLAGAIYSVPGATRP